MVKGDVTLRQMKHSQISFMFSQQITCPWWCCAILATSFFNNQKEKGYHRCCNKILQWTQVILTNKTSSEKILSCVAKNGSFWLKKGSRLAKQLLVSLKLIGDDRNNLTNQEGVTFFSFSS
jgi:hypothetical protein